MRIELETKIKNAPTDPGCYFWKDNNNKIIYIGKAKNINKRIQQYFDKNVDNKTKKLVSCIYDLDFIIVNNDNEALVLENNLIKKYKPKFNVLLKESSNYPYIILTSELNPRIIYTRKYNSYKGKSFGPFPSSEINSYEIYNLLQRIIPLRKCGVVPNKKCIYYDLKQCIGPCINDISKLEYSNIKKNVIDIFNNKTKSVLSELKYLELNSSKKLDFESANYYLELQNSLKNINHKQIVEFSNKNNIDIVGYYCDENYISIIIFNIYEGKLLSKNENISRYYNNNYNEVILSYLMQYYTENQIPKNLYINLDSEYNKEFCEILNINIEFPKNSKYEKLILLAIKNAKNFLTNNKLKNDSIFERTIGACEKLSKLLEINYCTRIDIIDNSNIFLENPVSSVVTYINGIKEKKLYRKFNLDKMENKSDYHFMIESLKRRYKNSNSIDQLPNLLIVDGGKIQISAAQKALNELNITTIKIIGLKKDKHHKTHSIINSNYDEICLDKNSSLYFLLCNMQEEVHRFAITYFREKRIKSQMSTFLDGIEGFGVSSRNKIISIYPNVYNLKDANVQTLQQIIGNKKAIILKEKIKELIGNK